MAYKERARTFEQCERVWRDHPRAVARSNSVSLGLENTRLVKHDDCFGITFHDHEIVRIYKDYSRIDACGYEDSPTTQQRIGEYTGARMSINRRLGFEQNIRVNGYPYFPGIRVDRAGHVLEEDRRLDHKRVVKKPVVQRYVKLFKRIKAALRGRWAIGEFNTRVEGVAASPQMITVIEWELDKGDGFITPECASAFLRGVYFSAGDDFDEHINRLREYYRSAYYKANDGYEIIEVK